MCALEKVWVCVCSASFFISHTHTHSHTCLPYEYKVSVCAHIHMRASRSATGVPKALLGHKVAKQKSRPTIPVVIPEGYKALMTRCWSHRPEDRCVCACMCVLCQCQACTGDASTALIRSGAGATGQRTGSMCRKGSKADLLWLSPSSMG